MKKTALIEKKKDGGYMVYSADTISTIIGEGVSVMEAKADFENTLKEVELDYEESGEALPEDLQGVVFEYKYDIASIFNYFDFINVSKFAKRVGINASLLRQYKTSNAYISEAQAMKIRQALRDVGEELSAISL